ncbi:hypothetical protein [Stenotrophomonas rhizophila]|uniref:hypothetical protein n=1 Tax=Stenotrophomonas rhizophila TaxID=216778 RepID=UPI001AEBDBCE|nr:hypothetical protein [Stenotrophomonas rhizophila]
MDATTQRTINMRARVAEAGGPAEWARKFGGTRWQQPQVSQWISETNPKGIGHRLARDLEAAMGVASGTLDRPSTNSQSVGLDVSTLRSAIRLLQLVSEIRGNGPVPDIDAEALATAYETVAAEARSLDDSNVVDFMRAFVDRLERSREKDGVKRGPAAGPGAATG